MRSAHRQAQLRSRIITAVTAAVFAMLIRPWGSHADEPDDSGQLPRLAPLEPDKALGSFQVAKGFRIEQVAAEPLVTDPVAMAFDEDGRLFVVEMRDYSEHPNERLGRVRLLEDTDGDGRMDKAVIFADKLSWPTAVICSQGGVFIGAAPDIRFLKDVDGDGKADENRVIYTGLGRGNVQGLVNSFLYGLDHRIHVAVSSAAGTLSRPDDPSFKPIPLRGRDFAFDPVTLAAEPITGGGQHGATFDDYGRRFVCSNSDHLQMVMIEDRHLANSPPGLVAPPARMSIAADGPQAEVYRISPVEPWRVLRTKLRVSGAVPGIVEGGGRAAGYFTSATGITVYRGDAMPDQRGNVFVADVGSNIIHRKRLTPRGIGFIGTRIDEKAEFVASTDTWFRPVQMANGPDGALWVADMYREVIEHPASLPPAIKKHLDLDSGRDRGRIYRVVADGFKQRVTPKLSKATTTELVALLEHDNAWHRETASRLIRERQAVDANLQLSIRKLLYQGRSPLGTVNALAVLDGAGCLLKSDALHGMTHPTAGVREHALRMAGRWVANDSKLVEVIAAFAHGDDDARVRHAAVLALGRGDDSGRSEAMGRVLLRDGEEPYMCWAAMSAAGGELVPLIEGLLKEQDNAWLVRQLSGRLGKKDIEPALKLLAEWNGPTTMQFLNGLSRSMVRAGSDPSMLIGRDHPEMLKLLESAWRRAETGVLKSEKIEQRLADIEWLSAAPFARSGKLLKRLVVPSESPDVAVAAAAALAGYPDVEAVPSLIEGVATAGPAARSVLLDALLSRGDRLLPLIQALELKTIPIAYLSAEQRARLLNASDEQLRIRASALYSVSVDRQAVVVRYLKGTASLPGDASRGKPLFAAQCAACHRLDGVGHELGPNLAAFAQKGTEAILVSLLDPNREVNPAYLNHVVELKDGEIISGIITSESAASMTITAGNGASRSFARASIASIRATGKSLMPEGMEASLSPQDVADLVAYLTSLTKAKP